MAKLQIKNFKKIKDQMTLLDFTRVNYLVGENGSGKTSILNAISFLQDGSNARHFFRANSIVDFSHNGGRNFIMWKEEDPNKTSHSGTLRLTIIVPESGEKGANGVIRNNYNYYSLDKDGLHLLNETLHLFSSPEITPKKKISDDVWDVTVGKMQFFQEETEINTGFIADGYKTFNDLRFKAQLLTRFSNESDAIIVILEEPENNLHPRFQKKVPDFLNNFINELNSDVKQKIFIFISTHSPFIIGSAANYANQKVYLLKDGSLCDPAGTLTNQSSGYKGSECAWVVGQMLGAEVTDFGYPENYCILEEYSLQVILDHCKMSGIVKNFQFISASGEANVIKFDDRLDNLSKLNTLIKCNPYYFDKYLIIVDSTKDFSQSQKEKYNRISARLGGRFIELSKKQIEDYYQNLDREIYDEFWGRVAGLQGDRVEIGKLKAEMADKITARINSKDDFSKLFEGELDSLIR